MSFHPTGVAMMAEAAYRSRYSKPDADLIEELCHKHGGEMHKATLHAKHEGTEFHLTFLPKQQGYVVSIACTLAGRFKVTRKTGLDRWMKSFVPAIPFRSRDERFDREFNVQTRDMEVTSALLTRPTNRAAVHKLFERGVRIVHLDGDRIKCTSPRKALSKTHPTRALLEVVESMTTLAAATTKFATHHEVRPVSKHDPLVIASWVTLGLLGIAGFFLLIAGGVEFTPVRPATFLLPCAIFGLPPIFPVIALLAMIVQRRTSPYGLVRGLAALAMVVVPLFVSGGMLTANGLFDDSSATDHVVTVIDKSRREDKNKVKYHVGLESWWTEGDSRWLQVSKRTYDQLVPDITRMRVRTREGRLGYEWIEGYGVEPQ